MSSGTVPQPFGGFAAQTAPLTRRPSATKVARASGRGRVLLVLLLVATAAAYTWNLTAMGEANSFYAAAVQAATKSWKALFFGSIDASNFITVDKPPASLWVMALSGRIFGFSSFSMLAPQVLEGVLTVWLLYAAVRRWFGEAAGLLAGLTLALTPVAALMFRFNNPDALLVCLLVAAAYAMVRAVDGAATRWLVLAGSLVGFAFLAKMMQAFLVLPAFALVYVVAAPTTLRRRLAQTAAGGLALLLSAGWWVAAVALWPTGSRPMIDGSSKNSILDLIVGYNGLGRIFGSGPPGRSGAFGGTAHALGGAAAHALGGAAMGGGGPNFSGSPGPLRLFNELMAGQASWLLPAALLTLIVGLWVTRRAPRTDVHRAGLLLWGGWLIVTGLVFSLASGVIHTYYTVALAPAVAALSAMGAVALWRAQNRREARVALAVAILLTGAWAWVILARTPDWEPWVRIAVAVAALLTAIGLLAPSSARGASRAGSRLLGCLAAVACLGGPAAFTVQTVGASHAGSVPAAGPQTGVQRVAAAPPGVPAGMLAALRRSASGPGGPGSGAGPGAGGGSGGMAKSNPALVRLLKTGGQGHRWAAAVSGSEPAASLELATGGTPVMAIGGFNGQGGDLTLAQFQAYVRSGAVHYFVVSAGNGGPGGGGPPPGLGGPNAAGVMPPPGGPMGGRTSSQIEAWVSAHFRALHVGSSTVYDLTVRTT